MAFHPTECSGQHAQLKLMAKALKGQQALACELYSTGNVDAMYLTGLVADGRAMAKKQLQEWARQHLRCR